jgi:prevent-host-death family protein
MATIGIRELRQHASVYLRQVAAGATLVVADRGRPVALLTPVREQTGLARLEAEARVTRARGDVLALGPPERARRHATLPSRALARVRRHER